MKEHAILFSTPMIKAIMDGRKSMTRRIVKDQPEEITTDMLDKHRWYAANNGDMFGDIDRELKCPYGKIGDILWVRETWQKAIDNSGDHPEFVKYLYKADGESWPDIKWKPSIFMPKEACRIRLEITDVRVERLCDISEEDAMAEGISLPNYAEQAIKDVHYPEPSDIYAELWDKINGAGSWIKNPWVWVISFKRL